MTPTPLEDVDDMKSSTQTRYVAVHHLGCRATGGGGRRTPNAKSAEQHDAIGLQLRLSFLVVVHEHV